MSRAPRTGGWGAAALGASAVLTAFGLLSGCSAPDASGAGAGAPTGPVHHATSAAPRLPVGHAGRWLTDADGRVLLLHGVNEVVKTPPYDPAARGFSDADAAWLAANGVDAVRLGVLASAALPAPGVVDTAYLEQLLAVARDLGRHGIVTLLDLHQDGYGAAFTGMDGFPAWMTRTDGAPDQHIPFPHEYDNPAVAAAFTAFWHDEQGPGGTGLQEDDTALLAALARTFAPLPSLLGYDVLNEPYPGTGATSCGTDGCESLQTSELAPFYDKADGAIRSADHTHLVLVEPFLQFAGKPGRVVLPLPAGDRLSGLSFHDYGTGSSDATEQAVAWAEHTGGAVLATEWGATADPGVADAKARAFDTALVPWAYWAFDDCCGDPPGADSLIRSRTGPPQGANATAVAGAVVRPHPLAVAGTPTSLSYDPGNRQLRFSWLAAAAGGGSFSPKSVTTMELPAAVYPAGYTVVARGAVVTSAPCAPLLTLRLLPGTGVASVLVKPGGSCPAPHPG